MRLALDIVPVEQNLETGGREGGNIRVSESESAFQRADI